MCLRFAVALVSVLTACGATGPSESEIYYAAALRPGVELATTGGERTLLNRIGELPSGLTTLDGESFELGGLYAAGSGRTCRRVRTARSERLACSGREAESPTWNFVPDPFRASADAATPAVPAAYDETVPAEAP
ncbi:MAG: hypothetical protein KDC95_23770 [Planctomycetes bacterium]|nr:hypothetical protein [Planctomycetota bacterium]